MAEKSLSGSRSFHTEIGNYITKYKGMGEVTVMEVAQVGVKTRAQTLAMAAASTSTTTKRRKISSGELQFGSSYVQIRSRHRLVITPENLILPANYGPMISSNLCSSPNSDLVRSSELLNERLRRSVVDLEEEGFEGSNSTNLFNRKRKETSPSSDHFESDDLDSTEKRPIEANSHLKSTKEKMPSDEEIDKFFSVAEKYEKKRFSEKYNYDIVKNIPLEGRYEWVRLNP